MSTISSIISTISGVLVSLWTKSPDGNEPSSDNSSRVANTTPISENITITPHQFVSLSFLYHANWRIKSHQRMQKLVFLLDEKLPDDTTIYSYESFNHGPHTNQLRHDLESLEERGFIEIKERRTYGGDERKHYYLTEYGANTFSSFIAKKDELKTLHKHTGAIFSKYGEMPLSNLIDFVVQSDPEYTKESNYY